METEKNTKEETEGRLNVSPVMSLDVGGVPWKFVLKPCADRIDPVTGSVMSKADRRCPYRGSPEATVTLTIVDGQIASSRCPLCDKVVMRVAQETMPEGT